MSLDLKEKKFYKLIDIFKYFSLPNQILATLSELFHRHILKPCHTPETLI